MQKLYFLFVLATHCGDGWVEYENNCYLFLNKEMDFVNGLVSKLHTYTKFGWYDYCITLKKSAISFNTFILKLESFEDGYPPKKVKRRNSQ